MSVEGIPVAALKSHLLHLANYMYCSLECMTTIWCPSCRVGGMMLFAFLVMGVPRARRLPPPDAPPLPPISPPPPSPTPPPPPPSDFVGDLEDCIRHHATRLAETFPQWGNKCDPVTSKVDFQAALYEETLTPMYNKHGYTGALWCSMYSLGMVPIVDLSQPNNPNL